MAKKSHKSKKLQHFFCSKWKIIMLDYPINTFSWNENLKYQKLSHVLLNIGQKLIKKYNGVIFCPIFNNKWPNFWYFEVFISAKCVYRIYLAYLLFIFSKKNSKFQIFGIFWAYYKYPRIPVYFSQEKCTQILKILL